MRDGGPFGVEWINRFNGGLFATIDPAPLSAAELTALHQAAALDWGAIEPANFGTLFEWLLDPSKRFQLGAQYSGRVDWVRIKQRCVQHAPEFFLDSVTLDIRNDARWFSMLFRLARNRKDSLRILNDPDEARFNA